MSDNLTKGDVMDFSKAHEGDTLWDNLYGDCFVVDVEEAGLWLRKGSGLCMENFFRKITGKTDAGTQLLYWSKPTITGGDIPPKRTVKKKVEGLVVVFKDGAMMVNDIGKRSSDDVVKIIAISTEIEVEE